VYRATDRNEHLVSLLRDLTGRVDDDDRARIESALNDVSVLSSNAQSRICFILLCPIVDVLTLPKSDDNDYDSPVPGTVGRPSRLQSSSYSQYSDFSRHQSRSQTSPLPTLYKPETNTTSPAPGTQLFSIHQGSNYDAESLSEYAARSPDTHEAGYLGQICEVQWLRSLKQRLQIPNLVPPAESPKPSETNFYLDDNGIRLLNRDNPFHLPPESQATLLSQCYFQTVHVTFPIIASEVESQLQIYYHSVLSGRPVMFPQSWYAVINFVLAIGARFSHITNAEWHLDPLDEMVYISRAFQLLGLNDTGIVLSAPDLPLIQVSPCYTHLSALLIVIGYWASRFLLHDYWSRQQVSMGPKRVRTLHCPSSLSTMYHTFCRLVFQEGLKTANPLDRAWITVGIALRAAVTSGLHTQSKYSSSDPNLNQATLKTWWSLYNLESLLGSMVGRPCMLQGEEVTTPLLSEVTNPQHQKEPIQPRVMAYSDAQVRLAMIAQKTLRKLYTERRTARSWSQIHTVITSLMQELDDWASEVMPQYNETPHAALNYDMKQMMLRNQYCRMKILITRPALRRIERCSDAGTEDFTAFDQEAAEACIQTAQDMSALLPENLEVKILYEKSPWWTIIHNSTYPHTHQKQHILRPYQSRKPSPSSSLA
jgi:hypothetical protein